MGQLSDRKYDSEATWDGKNDGKKGEFKVRFKVPGSSQTDGMLFQLLHSKDLFLAVERDTIIKIGKSQLGSFTGGEDGEVIYTFKMSIKDWLPTREQQEEIQEKNLRLIVVDLSAQITERQPIAIDNL